MAGQARGSRWRGRGFALLMAVAVLTGCGTNLTGLPTAISCQPWGYSPAPVDLTFRPGPVTQAQAEETGLALIRACGLVGQTVEKVDAATESGTGMRRGPNAGQAVWLVQVDATVNPGGGSYEAHWLIEVNQATGVPTVVGQG